MESNTAVASGASELNLLYFTATWCAPCRVQRPIMRELLDEGHAIAVIDIDSSPDLATRHGITGVPTIIVTRDGEEVDRHIGLITKDALKKKLESLT